MGATEGPTIRPFDVPLARPLSTATGTIDRRRGFLVGLSHRGRTGIGEASPLPGWTESLDACESALERALAASQDGDWDDARRVIAGEDVPAAGHALETALQDADARAEGVPLAAWLSADRAGSSVPVNATIGDSDPGATVDAAEEAVAAGVTCLKLKVGARALAADLARVGAVREAVGPADKVRLRVDANGAWSRETAERALDALEAYDVTYAEQPVAAEDLDGLAALRGGAVDIAVDETLAHASVGTVIDHEVADVAVLKPMVLGGPGTTYTVATRCRAAGIDPVISTTVDAVVARTAAVHVAGALPTVRPCGLATASLLAADVAPDPAPVSDGRIAVPEGPGLGVNHKEVWP